MTISSIKTRSRQFSRCLLYMVRLLLGGWLLMLIAVAAGISCLIVLPFLGLKMFFTSKY